MCKYCKIKDGIIYSEIASGYPKQEGRKGFVMTLQQNNINKIEESREKLSFDAKETISYIKAYHYEFGKLEDSDHIAVEIQYCPFCGRKL